MHILWRKERRGGSSALANVITAWRWWEWKSWFATLLVSVADIFPTRSTLLYQHYVSWLTKFLKIQWSALMSWYELAPAHHWKMAGMAITFNEACYIPGTEWDILHILFSLILLLNAERQGQTSPTINSFVERYSYGWIYFYIFFSTTSEGIFVIPVMDN